jgi:multidrug efflux pump
MKIADICIQRPVFSTVLSLAVLLIGAVSYTKLTVREYPKIDEPVVNVSTTYTGAAAEIIETQVTKILEDSIAGIEGIEVLTSISRAEQSQITARFKLEKNPDDAAAEVRDRVSRVLGRLPTDILPPVIAKVEADAFPIIWLAMTSDKVNALQMTDLANNIVKPLVQTLPGAADVRIFGERRYAMRIWLDADRMSAMKVTTQDVENALRNGNVEVPAGRIEGSLREYSVVSNTDMSRPSEFENVIIRTVNGYPVKLQDVARVKMEAQNERTNVRLNGKSSVSVGVIKQATGNPLELAKAVRAAMPKIEKDLPPGVTISIANDNTVFIERSIENVYKTIAEAVVLVLLVILFFLRSIRAALIPLVTIPVSLVGTFALMALAGFTINTLTLLAIVLAIGLVVDDAIVVLENIYRHIEEGMAPMDAAFKGTKEIALAVVAMTLTLAAVYAPVAFTTGRTGKLFIEFALTLAGAVMVSGFVALTLSPMMCSRLLKHQTTHGVVYNMIESFLVALTNGYKRILKFVVKAKWFVLLFWCGLIALMVFQWGELKKELAPIEDRGSVFVRIEGPEGATAQYMNRYANAVERIGESVPEIDRRYLVLGNPVVNEGIGFFRTTPWEERTKKTVDMVKEVQPKLSGISGVNAFASPPGSFGVSPRETPVSFVLQSTGSYQELNRVANLIMGEARNNAGLIGVSADLRLNKPELRIDVDREKLADQEIPVVTVARAMETMLGGRVVTRFKRDGEQFDVIVQQEPSARGAPDDIEKLYVRAKGDTMVPLSSVVKLRETVSPRSLNHFGQRRAVIISANLSPGYTLGQAIEFMEITARKHLVPGMATDLTGQSREFKASSNALAISFVLALAFIFLVLAAQFESFVSPLVIMFTVPLSMVGALGALQLTGGTINVYSQIGLITLVGLITKHGILIVEFASQLMEQGVPKIEAIIQAASLRLRPILMTTGAMVLGAIPLALAKGAGAESRIQIGWVIVGGLTLGTVLTLFVVPAILALFPNKHAKKAMLASEPAGVAAVPVLQAAVSIKAE